MRSIAVAVLWAGATTLLWARAPGAGWCDLVFKDVAGAAELVILAQYRGGGAGQSLVTVIDVFKGSYADETLPLDPAEIRHFRLRDGDHLLLALNSRHEPVQTVAGMGACSAVGILPVRGGKLRGSDRQGYDNQSKVLTLEELRSDLTRHLGNGS